MPDTDMVTVITGCSTGLGFHVASYLARASPSVDIVFACRDVLKARAAASIIARHSRVDPSRLIVLDTPLQLADLESVRSYASALSSYLTARGQSINLIINNAGVGGMPALKPSRQGFDTIFATNHLGHFLLTLLLLPVTTAATPGEFHPPLRIINVSSEVHNPATNTGLPNPSEFWPETDAAYDEVLARGLPPTPKEGTDSIKAGSRRYARSKLCNVLFTHELARRTSGVAPPPPAAVSSAPGARSNTLPGARRIEVLAFNPGAMLDTGFVAGIAGSGVIGAVAWALSPLLRLSPFGRLMRSGQSSGADLGVVATLPTPLGPPPGSAPYYDGRVQQPASAFATSEAGAQAAADLWRHSVRWAALTPSELAAAGF